MGEEGGLEVPESAPLSALALVVICEMAAEIKPVDGLLFTVESYMWLLSFGVGISIVNVGGEGGVGVGREREVGAVFVVDSVPFLFTLDVLFFKLILIQKLRVLYGVKCKQMNSSLPHKRVAE